MKTYDAAAGRFRGHSALPADSGMYRSAEERDACGVGFIANFKSEQSSNLIQDALVMLCNMDHRGGCGCEENSGDGAGIMIGMPRDFYQAVAKESFGVALPKHGDFGIGNIFLPQDAARRAHWKSVVEARLADRKVKLIGWRKAPTDNGTIGRSALKTEPYVEQVFVENVEGWDAKKFDLMLFVVCQSVRREALQAGEQDMVYICSLSSQTMVFKGQLTSAQVREYYGDLRNPALKSHFALVHSRFSTNTFPSWDRAHPNRVICHNGEINTLRGNKNMMGAREGQMRSPLLPKQEDTNLLMPVCSEDYSDSGNFDACLELLCKASPRSLPEAVMMMLPEAWQNNEDLSPEKRGFYEFNSCLMEPWDGPAMIAFADGRYLGCVLDRNGLRPHRYYITEDYVVAASEVGVIPHLNEEDVIDKGRLQPGKMFLVDFERQGIVGDEELKHQLATARPYASWVEDNMLRLSKLAPGFGRRAFAPQHEEQLEEDASDSAASELNNMLNMFGFSVETLDMLLPPMVNMPKEALGSMGVDTPLACLSTQSRSIFDYFKQLFAQVTNPPMDSIREQVVMAMECPVGPMANILEVGASQASRLLVKDPILRPREATCVIQLKQKGWRCVVLDATYARGQAPGALDAALTRLCAEARAAINDKGATCLFLSDRKAGPDDLPVPSLMALGAVHQHLLRTKERTRVALVVESGDAREVHHFCCLLGFGADAIYPYMAYEALKHLHLQGKLPAQSTMDGCIDKYIYACGAGIRKVMGKIGISTVQSYKGAQIFEAVGVGEELMERCFRGTASRIGGITVATIERDSARQHEVAWPRASADAIPGRTLLNNPGEFNFRDGGEAHFNDPKTIVGIQQAAQTGSRETYWAFAEHANEQASKCTLRGLLQFKQAATPLPIEEVEPASEIVKRFVSGAMSFGSISKEAHETLAIAMNELGGKSNTGEGGEDPSRFTYMGPNGERKRSAIKQIASGRFGVDIHYLSNADELQIKMAQGAKPGEGGELPGKKVFGQIAVIRNSTEGVGLISPPPHHDIYSIEDLAQLIHDLKNSNPRARISVKLVSEVGVGVIAAGVAKAKADHIVVSGHDGGTGAAAWTGIKHCGLPWELGIAETQQTLVLNNLRSRVTLQTDGQMKTGRDVAVAFLLGAEEVAFATAPLIALGCIMMRKCHLNTCPVGIATQDPELRKKFFGKPEHVVNYLFMVAEEVRTYMAQMGVRSVQEMVGRAELLEPSTTAVVSDKLAMLDLSKILQPSRKIALESPMSLVAPGEEVHLTQNMFQDHGLEKALDMTLIEEARPALEGLRPVAVEHKVYNVNRTVGTMLSHEIAKRYGKQGLPDNTIRIKLLGSAGQSCGAFLAPGVTIDVVGDANDYLGKGLSGGIVSVYPSAKFRGVAEDNMIAGNVCLYGATGGKCYIRGRAGERFCVRNSGAVVVVEGCGDHGLEYMTGGRVTILGSTGRNFGAGMSGGVAFVYDDGNGKPFAGKCNKELIALERLTADDVACLQGDLQRHVAATGSALAQRMLDDFAGALEGFVKVYPRDLRAIIEAKTGTPGFRLPPWFPGSDAVIAEGGALAVGGPPTFQPPRVGAGIGSGAARAGAIAPAPVSASTSASASANFADMEDLGAGGCGSTSGSGSGSDEEEKGADKVAALKQKQQQKKKSSGLSVNETAATVATVEVAPASSVSASASSSSSASASSASASSTAAVAYEDFVTRRDGSVGPWNKLRGFVEYERDPEKYRTVGERLQDWREVQTPPMERDHVERKRQAARCMDCGTPFCQTHDGCPINNLIPEFNELVYRDQWKEALDRLLLTNNFPEFTGKVCPAPCEGSCVAGLIDDPVTIKNMEAAIIDRGFREGWIQPQPPTERSGRTVAVVGSGPAGLACADMLNRAGHLVTVFERDDRVGGLLMYGIPNMKLEKSTVQRRVDLLAAEGIRFVTSAHVGVDANFSLQRIRKDTDAVVLTVGSTRPRDLGVAGRELKGIHFAMEFLSKNTKTLLDDGKGQLRKWDNTYVSAKGKNVVVIGGGDTGCDALGTSVRHGCKSLVNFELMAQPPNERAGDNPWPEWPKVFRTDYGHEEAAETFGADPRIYGIRTEGFLGDDDGNVVGIKTVLVQWKGRDVVPLPGTERIIPADLVILALGFLGPEESIMQELKLEQDGRSNIKAPYGEYQTNVEGVFAAGDCRRGQSLVVWAINEGRGAAEKVSTYLANPATPPRL